MSHVGKAARSFGLPSLLLVMVLLAHLAPDVIGSFYEPPNQARAAAAWQHVLRAFPETALLYMLVWMSIPWRPLVVRYAASAACAWGALESFQIAACRLQYPMDRPPPKTELFTGLCDVVTGWPIYMLTIGVVLVISLRRTP